MVLCNYCKYSLESKPPDAYIKHHNRLKDLEASSYRCQLCKLILSGFNVASQPPATNGAAAQEYRYISVVSRSSRGQGIRRRIKFSGTSWTGEVARNVTSLTSQGMPH
jgi:hypothetical protein